MILEDDLKLEVFHFMNIYKEFTGHEKLNGNFSIERSYPVF